MRFRKLAVAAATTALAGTATAQIAGDIDPDHAGYKTPTAPVGQFKPNFIDTGALVNAAEAPSLLFSQLITQPEARWIRLYFGEVNLEPGSYVKVTSQLDGEAQVLDAGAMEMWNNSTAYLNGSSVLLEVFGGPKTTGTRVVLEQIAFEIHPSIEAGLGGQCGICGPTDDREPSSEQWTSRLFPSGCTASIYNESSCMVTAGHCVGGSMVVQFNVPLSNPNCSTNNPPVADQFPASILAFSNQGVGNDWGVLQAGTNNLGQTPYERYSALRPISQGFATIGDPVELTGYGVDFTCTLSQTQQFSTGQICAAGINFYDFDVDLRGGNSGSALIKDDEIIGIATHCPCCNAATRITRIELDAAVGLCPFEQTPIATGPSLFTDGYLLVSPDPYGSWTDSSSLLGSLYNPVGAEGALESAFTAGAYFFADGDKRELLTVDGDWLATFGNFPDLSLDSEITTTLAGSDTSGDGEDDTATSSFRVSGGTIDVTCDLVQTVESVTVVAAGTPAALLTQEYTFTNQTGSPVDFTLLRVLDADLLWEGDATDDSVGTGTNAGGPETYVYVQEAGDPSTAITMSSPSAEFYTGAKQGFDPDGPGGSPPYGAGTDTEYWAGYGTPTGWRNNIAGVGYDTDGDSGPDTGGPSPDAHISLSIPVSLDAGPGPGSTATVVVHHTFGATEPLLPVLPCVWDCESVPDGLVGINDFLELLSQWNMAGTCDFDGGGVGINDFLDLLGNWGPCP